MRTAVGFFILSLPYKRKKSVLNLSLIFFIAFKAFPKDFFFVLYSDNNCKNIGQKAQQRPERAKHNRN